MGFSLILMFAVLAAFVISPTRPVIIWLISIPAGPLLVRFRYSFSPDWRAQPLEHDDPRVPESVRNWTASQAAELLPHGFIDHGLWLMDSGGGLVLVYMRVLTHPQTGCFGSMQSMMSNGFSFPIVVLGTRRPAGSITTSSVRSPSLAPRADTRFFALPSIGRAGWMWRVHRALVDREPAAAFICPPTDREALTALITEENHQELARLCERGIMRRTRAGGWRATWRGAFWIAWRELWPWKQRVRSRVLAAEERTLGELGLTELLIEARAQPSALPIVRHGTLLRIPDDAGEARSISPAGAGDDDERRGDPKFRAILDQAAAARKRSVSRGAVWMGAIMGASVLTMWMLFRIPPWIAAFVSMVGVMACLSIMNTGRAAKGEQDAADVYLRRGLCASCLYSLASLLPDEKGLLRCPECGARWKAGRVREFATFTADAARESGLPPGARRTLGLFLGGSSNGRAGKDHRGAHCRLIAPQLRSERVLATGEHRERVTRAWADIRRSGRIVRWLTVAVLLSFSLFPATMLIITRGWWSVPFLVVAFPAAWGTLMAIVIVRGDFAYRRNDILRAMLKQELCPVCAEQLSMRTLEPDGCVQCVCGAAWRVATRVPAAPPTRPTRPIV